MNIGAAARASGLPAKTIRFYEDIRLVVADRRPNGFRDYDEPAVRKLRFVQRARSLGFSIDACRNLLSLYEDRDRSSADVKALATERLADVEAKLQELHLLHSELTHLIEACRGDTRPDCPIIDELAGNEPPGPS